MKSAAVRNENRRLRAYLETLNAESQAPKPSAREWRVTPSLVEQGLAPAPRPFPPSAANRDSELEQAMARGCPKCGPGNCYCDPCFGN